MKALLFNTLAFIWRFHDKTKGTQPPIHEVDWKHKLMQGTSGIGNATGAIKLAGNSAEYKDTFFVSDDFASSMNHVWIFFFNKRFVIQLRNVFISCNTKHSLFCPF